MKEIWAYWFWGLIGVYFAAGFVFAVAFVTIWVSRLELGAARGSWGFRLAILPGAAALWPLLVPKIFRAWGGRYTPPDAERTATATRLRRRQGESWLWLAALVPVVCGAALLSRPREHQATVLSLEPPILPEILSVQTASGLPIEITMRTDGRQKQLQLSVGRSLDEPLVAAYWTPQAATSLSDAVFLGSVWGPARLTFSLPAQSLAHPGVLTLIALSGDQRVLAMLPL